MPDSQRTATECPSQRVSALPCAAVRTLASAIERTGSALSIGLEPCEAYLPAGFAPDHAGYERFLRTIIEATSGLAAAYKFNLAFFEALGPTGWELLFKVRRAIPADVLVIADAKRGDIGTTAEHYARALYDELGADSATVNPLMGRDACEPFLAHADKLTFFLVLTSNPGAKDFLLPGGLYRSIARRIVEWNSLGNAGMVVGATQPDQVAEVRAIAPTIPFLVPGIGAQGGDLERVARSGSILHEAGPGSPKPRTIHASGSLLFHVSRGILPSRDESGDAAALIRAKTTEWHRRVAGALRAAGGDA